MRENWFAKVCPSFRRRVLVTRGKIAVDGGGRVKGRGRGGEGGGKKM